MAELSKTYDPKSVEPKWYQRWIDDRDFEANPKSSKPAFSVVMPPPNITGVLTLGHVLNNSIQDILARRARMQGFEVLWLPGMDHAGIGTQTAVEKWLRKNEGVTRHDLGREKFLHRVLEWQDKHGGIIIQQLKRLGCSADWSRQRYTFDDDYVRAVQNIFVDLYDKGLIYRGRRMINWDPSAQTALSDEEVISKPQRGNLYYVRYEIVEEPGKFLEVATTRPETIMADTGVAVHPNDKRYADLLGKNVWRPLAREKIPIVADEAIDPEFGTGVLKVTPAHDKIDFEIGQRHKLPVIDILTPNGKITCPAVPELHGLDRFEARKKAAELLQGRELLSKTEPHENNVGFSDRSDVPIEPRISEQWFLRYPKTKEALAVVQEHLIRFFPAHWERVYAQWLEKIQDWCISRQVWWGHRIPIWIFRYQDQVFPESLPKKFLPDFKSVSETTGKEISLSGVQDAKTLLRYEELYREDESLTVYAATTHPAEIKELEKHGFQQDSDTLDTWFSSWLWAYETMDAETRAKFYPTSALVTGPDIIFFWVARMIIAGLEFRPGKSEKVEDNIPFRDVFFTGIIRDHRGRKMSKSLGNSPDPLELIDKYGADGLRFGLMRIAPSGQDIRFEEKQIEEGRNFATKLWNVARFRQMQGPRQGVPALVAHDLSNAAITVLRRLVETVDFVESAYRGYEFNLVAQAIYTFVWSDYCDWFVEAVKRDVSGSDLAEREMALAVMDYVLSVSLRLLHPFMPHLTAELWEKLGFDEENHQKKTISFSRLSADALKADWEAVKAKTPDNQTVPERTTMAYEVVQRARALRAKAGLRRADAATLIIHHIRDPFNPEDYRLMERLTDSSQYTFSFVDNFSDQTLRDPLPFGGKLLLQAERKIDRAAERERLDKEIARFEDELRTVETKLSNKSFVDRAPAAVVEEHKQRQRDFADQLAKLKQARERLA